MPRRSYFPQPRMEPGSSSITLRIPTGLNHTQAFYVYGLADTGTVPYTASATGYGTAQSTVTLTPSGIIIYGPQGVGQPSFNTSVGQSPAVINAFTDATQCFG